MKTKPVLWLGILLFVMACELPGLNPAATSPPEIISSTPVIEALPTVTPACISITPTQDDIDRALNFTGKLFETGGWERSYTVKDYKVSVSWLSETLYSIAVLEALIFSCGYEELDLNTYFNEENWNIIFGNYDSYQLVTECRNDRGLRLYQFNAVSDGAPYLVRYWAQNDTKNRVLTFMLAVPEGSFELLDSYGYSLFPQLSNCS